MSQVVKPTGNKHNLGLDMWSGPYPTHYLGKRPGNENDWGCPSCPNFVLWVGCPVAVSKQNSFEISFSGHLSGAPANNSARSCLGQETGSKLLRPIKVCADTFWNFTQALIHLRSCHLDREKPWGRVCWPVLEFHTGFDSLLFMSPSMRKSYE